MSAAIDLSAVVNSRDISNLMRQMQRAQKELGWSLSRSVSLAASSLATTLSASTKVSKKKRRIIRNPDKRYKTDSRRAPFGVMRYKKGKKIFQPIYRTGEFGGIRFFDKKSASWFRHQGGEWNSLPSGPDAVTPDAWVPGIKTDKRRLIGRSGLAKKTWQRASSAAYRGGVLRPYDRSSGRVIVKKKGVNPSVEIVNHLRYAMDAFKSAGDQALNTATERAFRLMRKKINDKVAKKMGAK